MDIGFSRGALLVGGQQAVVKTAISDDDAEQLGVDHPLGGADRGDDDADLAARDHADADDRGVLGDRARERRARRRIAW